MLAKAVGLMDAGEIAGHAIQMKNVKVAVVFVYLIVLEKNAEVMVAGEVVELVFLGKVAIVILNVLRLVQ